MTVQPGDLMTLQAYSLHRERQRRAMIAHRRLRSVSLGPELRMQFEDVLTVRHQIQEMLWVDRTLCDQAVQQEIDTYAHLVPNGTQWIATVLIELPDAAERERLMPSLNEAVHAIYAEQRGLPRAWARANDDLPDRHLGRHSGVHFLRFQLEPGFRAGLSRGGDVVLGCDHPRYHWRRVIPRATLASLCLDVVQPSRHAGHHTGHHADHQAGQSASAFS